MKSKSSRRGKALDEGKGFADDILNIMFKQAKAQFGNAVKSFWFYEDEMCPACSQHPIGVVKFKGKDALPINGFMYRERGVLIGYFLCETCAKYIFKEAEKNPYTQTPLHADIEQNLITAYQKHLMSLNA
ncbi:MAG: hypothetical protein Q7T89_20030 [Anaerolineales bacterium]|nr:hypothetical protein [Anaerolineales bacterium]